MYNVRRILRSHTNADTDVTGIQKNQCENFIPPPTDMTHKHRMKRLQKKLTWQGLYVRPVYSDDTYSEISYFIVSLNDPYLAK